MHSTLQAELRLTKRLIRSSCRQCTEHRNPQKRPFHSRSALRASQGSRNDIHSASGSNGTSETKSNELDREKSRNQPKFEQTASIAGKEQISSNGGPPPEDSENAQQTQFYGSMSKRRLRSRAAKEPESLKTLPNWFESCNICLFGEGRLDLDLPSSIGHARTNLVTGELIFETEKPQIKENISRTKFNDSIIDGAELQDSVSRRAHGHVDGDTTKKFQEKSRNLEDFVSEAGHLRTTSAVRSDSDITRSKRYFIASEQLLEVLRTTRGLLQTSKSGEHHPEITEQPSHLSIQYAGRDGEVFLTHLVDSVAATLGCDVMSIDAQDLSDLIGNSNQRPEILGESQMLSYEVYNDIYGENSPFETESVTIIEDDDGENADHFEHSSTSNSMGMPVIIGKPITIDLKSMFGSPSGSGRSDQSMFPKQFLSDMFRNSSPKQRTSGHIFSGIVEEMLTLLQQKQKNVVKTSGQRLEELRGAASQLNGVPKSAKIIHVKEFKSIQATSIGKQFLSELFEQVNRHRKAGESVIVVGTDTATEDGQYSASRIEDIQKGRPDEFSRTIVITPAFPNTISRLALLQDRKLRIASINMRHLWNALQHHAPSIFGFLKPGFWSQDFLHKLKAADRTSLESGLWNFSHVQRLATFMAGVEPGVLELPQVRGITDREDLKEHLAAVMKHDRFATIDTMSRELKLSDRSKKVWADRQTKNTTDLTIEQPKSVEDARLARIRSGANKYEKRLLSGVVEPDNISTTFNDVHVPVETIDALQTLTTLSLIRPEAFKYGVLATDKIPGLLLYGPPGTGKTLLAKAVAKESGATVLEVSAADINDMYVGEGEKNVKALFSLAKKLSPCVVFLDEADAMFSARSNSGRRVSHRELLNQFLKEWDGMSNDSGSAFIMVATNRPMDLDDAVLRRLPRRLLVDLPTEADRLEILKIHLRNEALAEDVKLADIANKTPFYSGSDLKNLAVAAALNAVREENEMAKNHQSEEPYEYPEKRILTANHFEKALEEISASISEDMSSLRDIKRFDEQYGDRRGRKQKSPKWGFRTAAEADQVLDTVKVRS